MPKPVLYRTNAIIYFQGDRAEGIPILKEGKVELSYQDLQTGAEIRESIRTGEFFGVKAALGNYPHDETAMAVSDCTVIHFSIPEFEALVSDKPRILMKMLNVFSRQLRRIHHQVQNLLSSDRIGTSQEAGLFAVGEYYLKEQQFPQAFNAFKRYLNHWPAGIYAPQATLKAGEAKAAQDGVGEETGGYSEAPSEYDAMSLNEIDTHYKLGRYKDALLGFLAVIEKEEDSEHHAYAEFRVGCCLYHLEKYQDAANQLASTIRKHPKSPILGEAIWYMGLSHEALGDSEKALGFFRKAARMMPEGSALYRQILSKIRDLDGGNSGS